jgi:hypothetical protein
MDGHASRWMGASMSISDEQHRTPGFLTSGLDHLDSSGLNGTELRPVYELRDHGELSLSKLARVAGVSNGPASREEERLVQLGLSPAGTIRRIAAIASSPPCPPEWRRGRRSSR